MNLSNTAEISSYEGTCCSGRAWGGCGFFMGAGRSSSTSSTTSEASVLRESFFFLLSAGAFFF